MWIRGVFLVGLYFVLSGCETSDTLQEQLSEYQIRMARVLDQAPPKLQSVSLAPYPAKAKLQQNIAVTHIQLSEFYTLKKCALYSLVAQRNTTLGRLHLPSTRFIYEQDLLLALERCISQATDTRLRDKLSIWLDTKQNDFPKQWGNLIQLSTEIRQSLSNNSAFINNTQPHGLAETLDAFKQLINLKSGAPITSSLLEQHLYNLERHALPAKLWLSQALLASQLQQSTDWLIKHQEQLQCSNGKAQQQITYLVNVFKLFFIQKIQPIASKMNHYQYQLQPVFNKLVAQPALSASFKQYIHAYNVLGYDSYQTAMAAHLRFWQDLFARCDINPGQEL
jgi:hypothetical protein